MCSTTINFTDYCGWNNLRQRCCSVSSWIVWCSTTTTELCVMIGCWQSKVQRQSITRLLDDDDAAAIDLPLILRLAHKMPDRGGKCLDRRRTIRARRWGSIVLMNEAHQRMIDCKQSVNPIYLCENDLLLCKQFRTRWVIDVGQIEYTFERKNRENFTFCCANVIGRNFNYAEP